MSREQEHRIQITVSPSKSPKDYPVVRTFRIPNVGVRTDVSAYVVLDGNQYRLVVGRGNGRLGFAEPEEIYQLLRELVSYIDELTYTLLLLHKTP
jgi:hypothetical protein